MRSDKRDYADDREVWSGKSYHAVLLWSTEARYAYEASMFFHFIEINRPSILLEGRKERGSSTSAEVGNTGSTSPESS